MQYIIKVPKKYEQKKIDFLNFINKYSPVDMLYEFSGRKYKNKVNIHHKLLGKSADFEDRVILVDFGNSLEYIFLCVCHELAHLVLRQKPVWSEQKEIRKILDKYGEFKSDQFNYSFEYAVEQTIATFLQAVCENRAGLRSLEYSLWDETFEALEISKFANVLFLEFVKYLTNINKYNNIDKWILEILKRYF